MSWTVRGVDQPSIDGEQRVGGDREVKGLGSRGGKVLGSKGLGSRGGKTSDCLATGCGHTSGSSSDWHSSSYAVATDSLPPNSIREGGGQTSRTITTGARECGGQTSVAGQA